MPKGDVETTFKNGHWTNLVEAEEATDRLFQTKDRAVEAGRELAKQRGVEHIIKNQDGTIAERNTYGDDPREIHG